MKVIKIGGGCLKDGPAAKKIIDLIAKRGQGDVFVLSAFYGVTDILISGIEKALKNSISGNPFDLPEPIRYLGGLQRIPSSHTEGPTGA